MDIKRFLDKEIKETLEELFEVAASKKDDLIVDSIQTIKSTLVNTLSESVEVHLSYEGVQDISDIQLELEEQLESIRDKPYYLGVKLVLVLILECIKSKTVDIQTVVSLIKAILNETEGPQTEIIEALNEYLLVIETEVSGIFYDEEITQTF